MKIYYLAILSMVFFTQSLDAKPNTENPPQEKADSNASKPVADFSRSNPFEFLKQIIPIKNLPPIQAVRQVDRLPNEDSIANKEVIVEVITSPRKANVKWGRKNLGETPIKIKTKGPSTPVDIVIRRRGYSPLRTRIFRRVSRKYFFKLTPAKFH